MDKIILLVNDAPELTNTFFELSNAYNYSEIDVHIINHIKRDIEKRQFEKVLSSHSGCTTCSNDLATVIASQPAESKILILDDDYQLNHTGTTEFLEDTLEMYKDGIGLIENGEIKILYIQKENFELNNYENVYQPENLMDYFINIKEVNRNRFVPQDFDY